MLTHQDHPQVVGQAVLHGMLGNALVQVSWDILVFQTILLVLRAARR